MTHRPGVGDEDETAVPGYDTVFLSLRGLGKAAYQHADLGVRWNRLGIAVYGVEVGTVSTAVGGWASSGSSGSSRLVVWISVTAALAIGAAWLAEPTVTLLTRYLQDWHGRRSMGQRLAPRRGRGGDCDTDRLSAGRGVWSATWIPSLCQPWPRPVCVA